MSVENKVYGSAILEQQLWCIQLTKEHELLKRIFYGGNNYNCLPFQGLA